MRDRTLRRFASRATACGSLAVLALACGARGPLDVDDLSGQPSNGTADAAAPSTTTDASSAATPDGSSSNDASSPLDARVDAPIDANVFTCGTCVVQQCGTAILTCLTDTTCSTELQCIATQCLAGDAGGGGGLGGACFLNCAGGSIAGLAPLLPVFSCITQTCGANCTSVLGGLGGGLGGLGGLGGG